MDLNKVSNLHSPLEKITCFTVQRNSGFPHAPEILGK